MSQRGSLLQLAFGDWAGQYDFSRWGEQREAGPGRVFFLAGGRGGGAQLYVQPCFLCAEVMWVQGGHAAAVWLLGWFGWGQMTLGGVTQCLAEKESRCETAFPWPSHHRGQAGEAGTRDPRVLGVWGWSG